MGVREVFISLSKTVSLRHTPSREVFEPRECYKTAKPLTVRLPSRSSGVNCFGFLNQRLNCDKSPIYMWLSASSTGVSFTTHSGGDTIRRTGHRGYLYDGGTGFNRTRFLRFSERRTPVVASECFYNLCDHLIYVLLL